MIVIFYPTLEGMEGNYNVCFYAKPALKFSVLFVVPMSPVTTAPRVQAPNYLLNGCETPNLSGYGLSV